MLNLLDPRSRAPSRQPGADQRIDEHFEIARHGRPGDARVSRHTCDVDHLCIAQRRDLQESSEASDVLDQRLLLHLLAQIGADVGLEHVDGLFRFTADLGQQARGQQLLEIEVELQLGRSQREELACDRAPRKHVRFESPELSRAGSAHREAVALAVLGDQGMHLVEQRRQPLDLVDDDPCPFRQRLDTRPEGVRPLGQLEHERHAQQIEPCRLRKPLAQPGALAGAARTEQEERLAGQRQRPCIHRDHFDGKK